MIKKVKKGNTLLLKGPARVSLVEGKMNIFGKTISQEKKLTGLDTLGDIEENAIIIPSAHNYPLYALEDSKLDIFTTNEDNIKEIEENSISDEWIEIKNLILKDLKKEDRKKPLKIMVLGISSGKTTLIKYLANSFLKEGLKGGYLDSDLGQQIIYLPTTINIGTLNNYVVSSESIQSEKTIFIGSTFPKGDYKFIVSISSRELIDDYFKRHKDSDFLLIDTDGWIKTDAGIVYKSFFIKSVDPDVLIIFHDDAIEELKEIEKVASAERKNRKIFLIKESNKYFYEKNKDERRFLRQSQFSKIFENFRKISIPFNNIKFIKTDYDKESDKILEREINLNDLINLPYHYVIISLCDENSELIEIGLLFTINVEKNYILLFSNISYKQQLRIKKIILGSLRLSTKGNHQGYLYL